MSQLNTNAAADQTDSNRSHITSYSETRKNSMKRTTSKQPKNGRAITQVSAWLKAVGAEVQPSPIAGCDLRIIHKVTGQPLDIKVAVMGDARSAAEVLTVLASDLASVKEKALAAFHTITEAAGLGSPTPVDRGPAPLKKRLQYDDHFELVGFRHTEFRRVPNPSTEELKQYEPTIAKAVNRFILINAPLCRRNILQADDLKTYAMVWTCNYLGLYKLRENRFNDVDRLLYAYLCQRFAEFASILGKKEKNCLIDAETAAVGLLGRTVDENSRRARYSTEDVEAHEVIDNESEEQDFILNGLSEEHQDLNGVQYEDNSSDDEAEFAADRAEEAARRRKSKASLEAALGTLDHDTLVTTLAEAAVNQHFCYDARREAQRQLQRHAKHCSVCATKVEE